MISTLEGKVAKVLNDREVVLNRGSDHGVQLGTRFKVMDETEEIVDPESSVSLGTITREKVRVKAVHVEPLMCVARTYETYIDSFRPSTFERILGEVTSGSVTKIKRIKADKRAQPDDSEVTFIDIGDLVVEVTGDE